MAVATLGTASTYCTKATQDNIGTQAKKPTTKFELVSNLSRPRRAWT